MSEPVILYPAIFVFSMLLIGLLLTMWEFNRMQKEIDQKAKRHKRVEGREPGVVNPHVQGVTGL